MMQLDLFGESEEADDLLQPDQYALFGEPLASAIRRSVTGDYPRFEVASPIRREHSVGEVIPSNLPSGWSLVADGWNGLRLVPPDGFEDHPEGGYGRFPYGSERGSLAAAVAEAEAICRRIVQHGDWTPMIRVTANHFVGRDEFEKFLLAWRAGQWGKRLPAKAQHYLRYLAQPGVLEQIPADLQPPRAAMQRSQSVAQQQIEAELEVELDDEKA